MTAPAFVLTFDDARLLVLSHRRPSWGLYGEAGTLAADTQGRQDASRFAVFVNSAEWLADGRLDLQVLDEPVYLVDRHSGAVTEVRVIDAFDLLDSMEPVTASV